MNAQTLQARAIREELERFAAGWPAGHPVYPDWMRARWMEALRNRVSDVQSADNECRLRTAVPALRLQGTDDVRILMLGGETGDPGVATVRFLRESPVGSMVIVVSLSETARRAVSRLTAETWLHLDRDDLVSIWLADDPTEALRCRLVDRLPRGFLNPFDYLHPVDGNMFTGRRSDLSRLRLEHQTSFAIAGPSRLGKTSLLRRYRNELISDSHPRATSTFYIDWLACKDLNYAGIADYLFRHIGGDARGHRLAVDQMHLQAYLRELREDLGQVTLLCDEIDLVCGTEAFMHLGVAARDRSCRLILAGKAGLLRWMNQKNSSFEGRLAMLKLQPLDLETSLGLILKPLQHLGVRVVDGDELADRLYSWTGGLPHILQFYGFQLVRASLEQDGIDPDTAERVHLQSETAAHVLADLQHIEDPLAQLAALLLLREERSPVSVGDILDLCEGAGAPGLTHARAVEIAEELFISNVLSWRNGEYVLANQALCEHASRRDFLTRGIETARRRWRLLPAPSAAEKASG